MRKILIGIGLLLALSVSAQELKCNVTINSSQIQGTNKQVFETLQTALNDFMNNHRWTDLTYATGERIECNFMFIVTKYEENMFTTTLQVQARRPVFGTVYSTTIFNFKDLNVNFNYVEFEPIEINSNTFENNLTAVLAYYAYMIIGFDLDSFQKLGGTAAFQTAEQIVNLSQSRSDGDGTGWKKSFSDNKNRYALINNVMDERFKKFRDYFYEYHRQALDNMSTNVDNARARIVTGLPVLRDLNRLDPGAILIMSFLDAKNDELINIFSSTKALPKERNDVYEVLMDVNPALGSRYEVIKP